MIRIGRATVEPCRPSTGRDHGESLHARCLFTSCLLLFLPGLLSKRRITRIATRAWRSPRRADRPATHCSEGESGLSDAEQVRQGTKHDAPSFSQLTEPRNLRLGWKLGRQVFDVNEVGQQ